MHAPRNPANRKLLHIARLHVRQPGAQRRDRGAVGGTVGADSSQDRRRFLPICDQFAEISRIGAWIAGNGAARVYQDEHFFGTIAGGSIVSASETFPQTHRASSASRHRREDPKNCIKTGASQWFRVETMAPGIARNMAKMWRASAQKGRLLAFFPPDSSLLGRCPGV